MLPSDPPPVTTLPRTALRRSSSNRVIAGVIGGLSTHFGLDPKLARIAWILVTLFGGGLVAYLAAWFVLPDDTEQRSMVPIALLLLVVVIPIGCGICAWLIQLAALASSPAFDSNF